MGKKRRKCKHELQISQQYKRSKFAIDYDEEEHAREKLKNALLLKISQSSTSVIDECVSAFIEEKYHEGYYENYWDKDVDFVMDNIIRTRKQLVYNALRYRLPKIAQNLECPVWWSNTCWEGNAPCVLRVPDHDDLNDVTCQTCYMVQNVSFESIMSDIECACVSCVVDCFDQDPRIFIESPCITCNEPLNIFANTELMYLCPIGMDICDIDNYDETLHDSHNCWKYLCYRKIIDPIIHDTIPLIPRDLRILISTFMCEM